jgi:hypothetical protein
VNPASRPDIAQRDTCHPENDRASAAKRRTASVASAAAVPWNNRIRARQTIQMGRYSGDTSVDTRKYAGSQENGIASG